MRYKCIECGKRALIENFYDGELHCSHAKCQNCGTKLLIWYDENNEKVILIEQNIDKKEVTKNAERRSFKVS